MFSTATAVSQPFRKVERKMKRKFKVTAEKFPMFLPSDVERIKDKFALKLATRIERLPVQVSFREVSIMSSFVTPLMRNEKTPAVLLHGFDSVYAEGKGDLATLPKAAAYAGVSQKTLILWGEDDQIISNKLAWRLHGELSNIRVEQISNCGHLPHVEKPAAVAKLNTEFVRETCRRKEVETIS